MDVILTISFKVTAETEIRKHVLRRTAVPGSSPAHLLPSFVLSFFLCFFPVFVFLVFFCLFILLFFYKYIPKYITVI